MTIIAARTLRRINMYEGGHPLLERYIQREKRRSRILRLGKVRGYGKRK